MTQPLPPDNDAPVAWALWYAARGWPVFPCHPPTTRGCSCRRDCGRVGKHPRTQHGLKDATTDEATIRRWWGMWPGANIGIATGAVSGLVVLDEDSYKGGSSSREELERSYGPLPETAQQLTGGGGVQYLFGHPGTHVKNGVETLGPGLDLRGDGGYVIAPPSLHISGKRYGWEWSSQPDEVPLAPIPPWLLALCQDTTRRETVDAGEVIPQGKRNDMLFRCGCQMRRQGFSQAVILAALREMNTTQCQPPLDASEVEQIASSCAKYAPGTAQQDAHGRQNGQQQHASGAQMSEAPEDNALNTFLASAPWPEISDLAFHGLAGKIVHTIEPHTEADPIAILVHLLVMFANLVGRTPHAIAEADRHFLNIFACLVGETSKGRKGVSAGYPRRLLTAVDNVWAQSRIMSGLSSGEGLLWYVRDPSYKQGKDGEEVCTDEGEPDKRLLVVEPEFARVLRVLAREGNTLSAVIRHAWDDGALQTMVSGRRVAPVQASGAFISIVGHVTADELRRNLAETETSNGFGNRFLWCCVRRSKLLPEGGLDRGPRASAASRACGASTPGAAALVGRRFPSLGEPTSHAPPRCMPRPRPQRTNRLEPPGVGAAVPYGWPAATHPWDRHDPGGACLLRPLQQAHTLLQPRLRAWPTARARLMGGSRMHKLMAKLWPRRVHTAARLVVHDCI